MCKQVVLTTEYAEAWQPRLSELLHVSVVSYNISGFGEMALRQQVHAMQRAVGLSALRDVFGLPKHSEVLLQDMELHKKIQVYQLTKDFGHRTVSSCNVCDPCVAMQWARAPFKGL